VSDGPFPHLVLQNRQRRVAVDLPALRAFARRALPAVLALPAQSGDVLAELDEISVALISDKAMAHFHVEFMGIAGPTDVLTFEHGEILISTETAARYAVEYGHTTQQEIALYVLHGLLHLRGYDDTTPAAHREMHRVQGEIFARI
jgi:probable rRNA maturation factor